MTGTFLHKQQAQDSRDSFRERGHTERGCAPSLWLSGTWGAGQAAADGFLGCRERLNLPPCPPAKEKQAQVSLCPPCGGWDLGGGIPASPMARAESQPGVWAGTGRQQHPSSEVTLSFPVPPVPLTGPAGLAGERGHSGTQEPPSPWHCSHPEESEGSGEGTQDPPPPSPSHLPGRFSSRRDQP